MALVDFVIPCYNYGNYLPACIASLTSQSMSDWRAIIIDDASTDGSPLVARELASRDRRIEIILHADNIGHIQTYNEGIHALRAPYFWLLSADDMLAPHALARTVSLMERHPDVVLTFGSTTELHGAASAEQAEASRESEWHIVPGDRLIRELCLYACDFVPTPSVLVRTAAQRKAGGYNPSLPHSGDLEMWLRMALLGSVAVTSSVQSLKRVHGRNMSAPYFIQGVEDHAQLAMAFRLFFEGAGSAMNDSRRLRRLAQLRLCLRTLRNAARRAQDGEWQNGMRMLRLATSLAASGLVVPPPGYFLGKPTLDPADLSRCRAGMQVGEVRRAEPGHRSRIGDVGGPQ